MSERIRLFSRDLHALMDYMDEFREVGQIPKRNTLGTGIVMETTIDALGGKWNELVLPGRPTGRQIRKTYRMLKKGKATAARRDGYPNRVFSKANPKDVLQWRTK